MNTTSTISGWENRFLCQIPRFQSQYNVHEYRHRSTVIVGEYEGGGQGAFTLYDTQKNSEIWRGTHNHTAFYSGGLVKTKLLNYIFKNSKGKLLAVRGNIFL
jgi:hypothetical protein